MYCTEVEVVFSGFLLRQTNEDLTKLEGEHWRDDEVKTGVGSNCIAIVFRVLYQ